MDARQVAHAFVDRFCTGRVDELEPLLADGFHLRGPRGAWGKADYLAALAADPPLPGRARILGVAADGEDVVMLYAHDRADRTVLVGQVFRVVDGRIARSLVAFAEGSDWLPPTTGTPA